MTVTSTPTSYPNFFATTLKRSMTTASQTSGIVLNAILENDNTPYILTSQAVILSYLKGGKKEIISASGFTQDSEGNFTLTGVTRDLPWDGSSFTGQGNPIRWTSGTTVLLSLTGQSLSDIALKSAANTFAGIQTFSEAPVFSKGGRFSAFADTTARDAYFTSPVNGDQCFVTGIGMQYYDAGWSTYGTATVNNAANGTKGIVDIATAAEIAAGTAVDATSGAINVIPVSQTAKTSSGAGDVNKIPVLNASGVLPINFLATGTPDGTKYVGDDGTLKTITAFNPLLQAPIADATTTSSASETIITDAGFFIELGAGTLVAKDTIKITLCANVETNIVANAIIRFKIGSTTISTITVAATSDLQSGDIIADCIFQIRTTGAGGTWIASLSARSSNTTHVLTGNVKTTGAIDTTASNTLQFSTQSGVGGANNEIRLYTASFTKFSI